MKNKENIACKLSNDFIMRIIKYKEIISEVEDTPLERTIDNFQRDWLPERELEIWEKIASDYKNLIDNNPDWTLVERKNAFKEILTATVRD